MTGFLGASFAILSLAFPFEASKQQLFRYFAGQARTGNGNGQRGFSLFSVSTFDPPRKARQPVG